MSVKETEKLPNYTPVQVYNSVGKIKTRVKRVILPADPQLEVELEVTAEMIDDVFGFNTGTRKQGITTTTFSKLKPRPTFKKKNK